MEGLAPHRDELQRDITHDDIEGLLGIPIRRISQFDLDKNRKDIERLQSELGEVELDLSGIVPYAIRYLKGVLRKYGADYPRHTRITTFGEISERELTAHELTINYDRERGYIGHKIAGEPLLVCSPLDKLLIIWKDGRCKMVAPPEKMFVDDSLIYCRILERERVMTAVYEMDLFTYYKKFAIGGLVTNRESRIAPKGANVRFLSGENPPALYIRYEADARIKIRQQRFMVERQPVGARDAKGLVLTANPIEFVGAEKAQDWDDTLNGPPGKFIDS
jgi:topoisomerase-4 subunit A